MALTPSTTLSRNTAAGGVRTSTCVIWVNTSIQSITSVKEVGQESPPTVICINNILTVIKDPDKSTSSWISCFSDLYGNWSLVMICYRQLTLWTVNKNSQWKVIRINETQPPLCWWGRSYWYSPRRTWLSWIGFQPRYVSLVALPLRKGWQTHYSY